MKPTNIEPYEVVELTADVPKGALLGDTDSTPAEGLRSGQQGTVLERYGDGEAFDVEFLDAAGYTLFFGTLPGDLLRKAAVAQKQPAAELVAA